MYVYAPPASGLQLSRDAAQRYEQLRAIRGRPRQKLRPPRWPRLRLQHAG